MNGYEALYSRVYKRAWVGRTLDILSYALGGVIAVFFAVGMCFAFLSSIAFAAKYALLSLIPFLAVSIMRAKINSPRPYEVISVAALEWLRERGRVGKSFPSRHTASAFIVAGALLPILPTLSVLSMIFGVGIGACRVLCGRHFLRDVLAGGAIGALSGAVIAIILIYL